jgi:hypothetical protein
MPELIVLRMKKHYGSNVAGEVASFSPETAAHILKHEGAEKLAELEAGERYDIKMGKVVKVGAPDQPAAPGAKK